MSHTTDDVSLPAPAASPDSSLSDASAGAGSLRPMWLESARTDLLDSLVTRGPMTIGELREDTGRSDGTVRRAMSYLRQHALVEPLGSYQVGDMVGVRYAITDRGRRQLNAAQSRTALPPLRRQTTTGRRKLSPPASVGSAEAGVGSPSDWNESEVIRWVLADHRRAARMAAAMRDVERERAIIRALVEHVAATVVDLASELSEIPVRVIRAELERLHADGVVLCDGDWWSLAPVGRVA